MPEHEGTTSFDALIIERYGSKEALYAAAIAHGEQQRAADVEAYLAAPDDFTLAWNYLRSHPVFTGDVGVGDSNFQSVLDIEVVRVNPATNEIEDEAHLNTATRVWLEAGPTWLRSEPASHGEHSVWEHCPDDQSVFSQVHDVALDVGAATFEAAIVALAWRVHVIYGDDRSLVYDPDQREQRARQFADGEQP